MHQKPCGLLNVSHYYDKLMEFLDYTVDQQFIEWEHRSMLLIEKNPETLLKKFEGYQPPKVDKAEWALRMSNS
jgi:hypothetical protein